MKVYYSHPVDALRDKGQSHRDNVNLIKQCGWEVCGPGIGDTPIINASESTFEVKKLIVERELKRIRESDLILIITDLKSFSAGSWMEYQYARSLGKKTIVFVKSKDKVKNIFIETTADKIIYNSKRELKKELDKIRTEIME